MTDNEKIKELLEASSDGVITAEQVTAAGLHRSVLQALVEKGEIYRFGRGLYALCNTWEDDFYLLQRKYGRGIYSHETALYLLGYSDRTPAHYTMTFPKGYNTPSLKKEKINNTYKHRKEKIWTSLLEKLKSLWLKRPYPTQGFTLQDLRMQIALQKSPWMPIVSIRCTYGLPMAAMTRKHQKKS